jgi:hypothetical protein
MLLIGVPCFMTAAQAQVDDVVDLVAGDQFLRFSPIPRSIELKAPDISLLFRRAVGRGLRIVQATESASGKDRAEVTRLA